VRNRSGIHVLARPTLHVVFKEFKQVLELEKHARTNSGHKSHFHIGL